MTDRPRLEVAVYGLINAGKSSLINALLGSNLRETGPVGGTTRDVVEVRWDESNSGLGGFDVHLIDTPGLEEIGDESKSRLATDAARSADLVLFVVAEDLTDSALDALQALHCLGKPIIVALNKVDLLDSSQEAEILESIRHRLVNIIDAGHVIAIAASPIIRERIQSEEGRSRIVARHGTPQIDALRDRLRSAVIESGVDLTGLNAIRDTIDVHSLDRDQDKATRRTRAERVADETSIALAMALAVNPIPLVDFLTGPTGLAILVTRVSAVYGERPDRETVRALASELFKGGKIVLWGSMAAVLGGGAMKLIPGLGHLAGALTQGTAAGYLAHVLGRGLVAYLENGHNWGDEGLVATLDRIAANTDRRTLTRGIVDQLKARLRSKREAH
jgi:small GTP-binding protein